MNDDDKPQVVSGSVPDEYDPTRPFDEQYPAAGGARPERALPPPKGKAGGRQLEDVLRDQAAVAAPSAFGTAPGSSYFRIMAHLDTMVDQATADMRVDGIERVVLHTEVYEVIRAAMVDTAKSSGASDEAVAEAIRFYRDTPMTAIDAGIVYGRRRFALSVWDQLPGSDPHLDLLVHAGANVIPYSSIVGTPVTAEPAALSAGRSMADIRRTLGDIRRLIANDNPALRGAALDLLDSLRADLKED